MNTTADMLPGTTHRTKANGVLRVVQYENYRKVLVEFVETGYRTIARSDTIRYGIIKDYLRPSVYGVGFVGVGTYATHVGGASGKMTPEYGVWHGMMFRCYSKMRHTLAPSYAGCSVAAIWHNFQEFAGWYHQNYPENGGEYQLDKDIKVEGNRVYSPETCTFVTLEVNVRHSLRPRMKAFEAISPEGVRLSGVNQASFCREHGLSPAAFSAVMQGKLRQHKGWTLAAISYA